MAIDKSKNQIVGCFLGSISDKSEVRLYDKENMQKTEKLQLLRDFSRLMWSGVSEFLPEVYQDALYLFGYSILVDLEHRGLKLVPQFLAMLNVHAYTHFGWKFLIDFVTNAITHPRQASVGTHILRWVYYDDYYVLGKKVFDFGKDSPHKAASTMDVFVKQIACARSFAHAA